MYITSNDEPPSSSSSREGTKWKKFVRLDEKLDVSIKIRLRHTTTVLSIGTFFKQMDFDVPKKSKHLRLGALISRMSNAVHLANIKLSSNGHLIMRFLNIVGSKMNVED